MKNFFVITFIIFVLAGCSQDEKNICDVLPKNSNYTIVIGDDMYVLTEHGLIYKGCYIDHEKWRGDAEYPVLDKKNKIIYINQTDPSIRLPDGIYKLDLTKSETVPSFVIKGDCPTVSPDGDFLTFAGDYADGVGHTVNLLNLKTGKVQELITDSYSVRPAWINDHKVMYRSYEDPFNKRKKKSKLYIVDINTMEKEDLQMPGYYPGAVTPNGKYIVLSGEKTVLYNLETKKIDKVLFRRDEDVFSMFWLPDNSGFIYCKQFWRDRLTLSEVCNVVYYSLTAKKNVTLIAKKDIGGGFVLPPDIELKPVINRYTRLYFDYPEDIKKICIK